MKLDCEVIGDLLPSYADGICSQATKELVEEHLAECPSCRTLEKRLRETALTGSGLERRVVGAVRRMQRREFWQGALSFLLPLLFLVPGFLSRDGLYFPHQEKIELLFFLILTGLFVRFCRPQRKMEKAEWIDLAKTLALSVTTVLWLLYLYTSLINGKEITWGDGYGPFPPTPAGEIAQSGYRAFESLQFVLYCIALHRMAKTGVRNLPVLGAALTGMYLAFFYLSVITSMNLEGGTLEEMLAYQLRETVLLFAVGFLGTAAMILLSKWSKGYRK